MDSMTTNVRAAYSDIVQGLYELAEDQAQPKSLNIVTWSVIALMAGAVVGEKNLGVPFTEAMYDDAIDWAEALGAEGALLQLEVNVEGETIKHDGVCWNSHAPNELLITMPTPKTQYHVEVFQGTSKQLEDRLYDITNQYQGMIFSVYPHLTVDDGWHIVWGHEA